MFSPGPTIAASVAENPRHWKSIRHALLATALTFLLTPCILAQSEVTADNYFGVGARAMGMGGGLIVTYGITRGTCLEKSERYSNNTQE